MRILILIGVETVKFPSNKSREHKNWCRQIDFSNMAMVEVEQTMKDKLFYFSLLSSAKENCAYAGQNY